MQDEILTIEEVAGYLRVSDRTVYDWAQKGEIPAGKIGTVWRFKKAEVERWVNDRLSAGIDNASSKQALKIKDILSPDRIIFIKHPTKHDAIVKLAQTLATAPQVKREKELIDGMLNREDLMSTAIGRGIAIPHVRLSSVTDLVMAVGICKVPVMDFSPIDDVPVTMIFMIAAAYSQHSYYLRVLSDLSAKLKDKDLRDRLTSAATEKEVYDILIDN